MRSQEGGPFILSGIKILDTVRIFDNCLAILSDRKRRSKHARAREMLAEISEEWARRRRDRVQVGEYFEWPSTHATKGEGRLRTGQWLNMGALKFMGYRVGRQSSEPDEWRQAVLTAFFESEIPPVFPDSYMDEWGKPKSARRLGKMANAISAFTRNARRREAGMETAIKMWTGDLRFLHNAFYTRKFRFEWPDVWS